MIVSDEQAIAALVDDRKFEALKTKFWADYETERLRFGERLLRAGAQAVESLEIERRRGYWEGVEAVLGAPIEANRALRGQEEA